MAKPAQVTVHRPDTQLSILSNLGKVIRLLRELPYSSNPWVRFCKVSNTLTTCR